MKAARTVVGTVAAQLGAVERPAGLGRQGAARMHGSARWLAL